MKRKKRKELSRPMQAVIVSSFLGVKKICNVSNYHSLSKKNENVRKNTQTYEHARTLLIGCK